MTSFRPARNRKRDKTATKTRRNHSELGQLPLGEKQILRQNVTAQAGGIIKTGAREKALQTGGLDFFPRTHTARFCTADRARARKLQEVQLNDRCLEGLKDLPSMGNGVGRGRHH